MYELDCGFTSTHTQMITVISLSVWFLISSRSDHSLLYADNFCHTYLFRLRSTVTGLNA